MRKYLLMSLILLGFNAHAGLEALTVPMTANSFTISCLENGNWQSCGNNTDGIRAGAYPYVIHTPSTGSSIAIGYVEEDDRANIVAACRSKNDDNWEDCSPNQEEIPYGDYLQYVRPADNGNGEIMVIGNGENYSLIAACRNALGTWYDCTPSQDTERFRPDGVNYTNNQWMVLSSDLTWDYENGVTYNPAMCMNPTGDWHACDMHVQDPNGDFYYDVWNFNQVQFVPASAEWVAVGMGYDDDYGDVFKSICRKNNDTFWHDCTSGNFSSNGADRLVQNKNGELIQLNHIMSGIYLVTQTLCKNPNGPWESCSFSLEQKNHIYAGITLDDADNFVLVGYQLSTNMSQNLAHLSATLTDNGWEVQSQVPADPQSIFADAIWVE